MDPKPTSPRMFAPSATPPRRPPGGYTVEDVPLEGNFELSKGRLIQCSPSGNAHTRSVRHTAIAVTTDPAVASSGIDAGHKLGPNTMRAPDVSIGIGDSDNPGWVQGPPLLAIEQASIGQDEDELQLKIRDLLQAGTKFVWVVRLIGLPRVEVYQRAQQKRTFMLDDMLTAPGVLKNPVPVRVFFDPDMADRIALRNLRERFGEDDQTAAVHGKASLVLLLLDTKKIALTPEQRSRIQLCQDDGQIDRWATALLTATTPADLGL